MKIGVFSDSHDNVNMIKIAVNLFNAEGVELVIHAGDFIAPFAVAAMSGLNCKVIGVFGNNDGERIGIAKGFESVGEVHNNLAEVAVGNRKICAMHYPELAEAIAKSGEYDIVIYGHTHQIDVRQEKSLILNPGEVGGWVTGKSTVAIVDLNSLEVEIHELQGYRLKVFIIGDLEGTAGVVDFQLQTYNDAKYYEQAKRLATLEARTICVCFPK